ncbi:MAG: ketopantoate reductase family protein [Solirubrobacteraceae bacterium]
MSERAPSIAVLGAGGVGGFVAAALARAGADVVVVAREPTAALVAERGLEVESVALKARFTARPASRPHLDTPTDVLVIATKAGALSGALERVRAEPELVVPLLNGIEHMTLLRGRFGPDRVAAGVIRIESDRPVPGRIVQTSPEVRIDLAADRPQPGKRLPALAAALEAAGLTARVQESERQVLWSKLARLAALSLTTSASDRPLGFVRSDPRWRSALEGAVNETVAVANADGARLRAPDTLAELRSAHAQLRSSMQRDIRAGREPELDALAGAVLRAAGRHGLRCPTVAWLAVTVAERAGLNWPPSSLAG